MGRGYPAIWSTVLSLPFFGGGLYLYFVPPERLQFSTVSVPPSDLQQIGLPLVAFGVFIMLLGFYVQFATPPKPSLQSDEKLIKSQHPSQRVAVSKTITSIPFLVAAVYLLFFTKHPYVYPTAAFLLGLYFFSSGLKTYWMNTLTAYYITSQRVISEYRFISLRRQEIPLSKVRGVEERRSIMEALVGLGNIRVASGGGGGSVRLAIRNIRDPTNFANELRNLIN